MAEKSDATALDIKAATTFRKALAKRASGKNNLRSWGWTELWSATVNYRFIHKDHVGLQVYWNPITNRVDVEAYHGYQR